MRRKNTVQPNSSLNFILYDMKASIKTSTHFRNYSIQIITFWSIFKFYQPCAVWRVLMNFEGMF
ncbi:unnamed protein product [Oikopleura dioica]|uniref:Uncharacterized protein n=1 Tax=Oikopleura dioica TaxID=34765 RepID=E4X8U7_OIKDI|nr:unnamed protein product [Oikopleura dioica]